MPSNEKWTGSLARSDGRSATSQPLATTPLAGQRHNAVLRTGFHCDYEQADLTNAQTSVSKLGCSCHLTRFQILLESERLAALRRIQERTTAPVASQIRRAVENWVAEQGEKNGAQAARQPRTLLTRQPDIGWSSGCPHSSGSLAVRRARLRTCRKAPMSTKNSPRRRPLLPSRRRRHG
jgi:hypothetical protein